MVLLSEVGVDDDEELQEAEPAKPDMSDSTRFISFSV